MFQVANRGVPRLAATLTAPWPHPDPSSYSSLAGTERSKDNMREELGIRSAVHVCLECYVQRTRARPLL